MPERGMFEEAMLRLVNKRLVDHQGKFNELNTKRIHLLNEYSRVEGEFIDQALRVEAHYYFKERLEHGDDYNMIVDYWRKVESERAMKRIYNDYSMLKVVDYSE